MFIYLVGPLRIADHAVGEAKVQLDGRVATVVGKRGGLGRGFPEILPARCAREAMLGQAACCVIFGWRAEDLRESEQQSVRTEYESGDGFVTQEGEAYGTDDRNSSSHRL